MSNKLIGLLFFVVASLPALSLAQNATTPGELTAPHPTLEHIAISWEIDGDDNADGVVSVRFREQGATLWRDGLPLVRVPADTNPEGYSWSNRHAGSLFGLSPDVSYEIELSLVDPDGGSVTETLMASTRPVPTVPATATQIDVTPDTAAAAIANAAPGDLIILGPGTYAPFTVTNDGEPGNPIVIRGTDLETVIVDGRISLNERAHVWIETLTATDVKLNSATGIVVRRCHLNAKDSATGHGIVSYLNGSTDGYFADNVIIGGSVWAEASLGVQGDNNGEGIQLAGAGNVIEYNRITGFRDCISLLEGSQAINQYSIDIIGNDLYECPDDGIEADFAMGNVRVLRNRLTNTFIGLSSQPNLGGPTYFIRNVQYNTIHLPYKPNRGSVGDHWYHNTVVKPGDALKVSTGVLWSRAFFRNNLFLGGPDNRSYTVGPDTYNNGEGAVAAMSSVDFATSDFDYDGFGSVGTGTFSGFIGDIGFDSLSELQTLTTEVHAVEVSMDIFAANIAFPDMPFPGYTAVDLRLQDGAAVDVGQPLPNINDGFAGGAPDLGAYELGSALPPYGPRTAGPVCGNGAVEIGESCDDSNTATGDGCDDRCQLEDGTDPGNGEDADAGPGAGAGDPDDEPSAGCGCHSGSGRGPESLLGAFLLALVLFFRRRSSRAEGA